MRIYHSAVKMHNNYDGTIGLVVDVFVDSAVTAVLCVSYDWGSRNRRISHQQGSSRCSVWDRMRQPLRTLTCCWIIHCCCFTHLPACSPLHIKHQTASPKWRNVVTRWFRKLLLLRHYEQQWGFRESEIALHLPLSWKRSKAVFMKFFKNMETWNRGHCHWCWVPVPMLSRTIHNRVTWYTGRYCVEPWKLLEKIWGWSFVMLFRPMEGMSGEREKEGKRVDVAFTD